MLHGYPTYNSVTTDPFYSSATPTEVGAFTPWVNPSGPAPALRAGGCCSHLHQLVPGRAASFAPWWGVSPLAAAVGLASVFWGNPGLQQLRLLHPSGVQEGKESRWRDASYACIRVFHFFRCIFSHPLDGSSDCNYLCLSDPAPFAGLCAFATVACCQTRCRCQIALTLKLHPRQLLWSIFNCW